jgi:hypothetical protein
MSPRYVIHNAFPLDMLLVNPAILSAHADYCVKASFGIFVNLEDLPAQSSKMLLGVGFACVYS